LITLTKKTKRLPELEKKYGDEKFLFPLGTKRPNRYDKPYIFYSCRVHAGEVGASYMLKGILEFIAEYKTNSDANAVLENYVILIIPMLNPDGVFRGHQRLDALGYDPNRVYNRAYKKRNFTP
jgi:murein tripeptide amidase MpaA